MPRAAPAATAGVAAGVATGAAAEVAAGTVLFELDGAAVEFDGDEQPANISDPQAAMARPARHAEAWVETCFMTVPFVTGMQ
jgi:hypothetical protein